MNSYLEIEIKKAREASDIASRAIINAMRSGDRVAIERAYAQAYAQAKALNSLLAFKSSFAQTSLYDVCVAINAMQP